MTRSIIILWIVGVLSSCGGDRVMYPNHREDISSWGVPSIINEFFSRNKSFPINSEGFEMDGWRAYVGKNKGVTVYVFTRNDEMIRIQFEDENNDRLMDSCFAYNKKKNEIVEVDNK